MNLKSSCRKFNAFRSFTCLLIPVFFFSQILFATQPEKVFWAERTRKLRGSSSMERPPQLASLPKPPTNPNSFSDIQIPRFANPPSFLDPSSKLISNPPSRISNPLQFFNTRESFVGSQGPKIILIQDVHQNFEAQKNIAQGLISLINQRKIGLVGVEGAFGKFNFSPFRTGSNKRLKKEIADCFLEEGIIGAPSYVGVVADNNIPPFIGVDDKTHYDLNVQAIFLGEKERNKYLAALSDEKNKLAALKKQLFGPSLTAIDVLNSDFVQGRMDLGNYLNALVKSGTPKEKSQIQFNPKIAPFLESYRIEKTLDFPRAEKERAAVLSRLGQKLEPIEISILLEAVASYQNGDLSFADLNKSLLKFFSKEKIDLKNYPAFADYLYYVFLTDGIDLDALLAEVHKISLAMVFRRARAPGEKQLVRWTRWVYLKEKLIRMAMVPSEWDEYKKEQSTSPFGWSSASLSVFENFYQEAETRSEKMVKNLFHAISRNPLMPAQSVVLFTGGFHTPQIARILRERDMPYQVYAPKITKIETDQGTEYLSLFTREKCPLERLFEVKRLSVMNSRTHMGGGPDSNYPNRLFSIFEKAIPQLEKGGKEAHWVVGNRKVTIRFLGSVTQLGQYLLRKPFKIGNRVVAFYGEYKDFAFNKILPLLKWEWGGLVGFMIIGILRLLISPDMNSFLLLVGIIAPIKYILDKFLGEAKGGGIASVLDPTDTPSADLAGEEISLETAISETQFVEIRRFFRENALVMTRDRVRQQFVEKFQELLRLSKENKLLEADFKSYGQLKLDWGLFTGMELPERIDGLDTVIEEISQALLPDLLSEESFTVFWTGRVKKDGQILAPIFGEHLAEVLARLNEFVLENSEYDHHDPAAEKRYLVNLRKYAAGLAREYVSHNRVAEFVRNVWDDAVQFIYSGVAIKDFEKAQVELLLAVVNELTQIKKSSGIKKRVVFTWQDPSLNEALKLGADLNLNELLESLKFDAQKVTVAISRSAEQFNSKNHDWSVSSRKTLFRALRDLLRSEDGDSSEAGKPPQELNPGFFLYETVQIAKSLYPGRLKLFRRGPQLDFRLKLPFVSKKLLRADYYLFWGHAQNGEQWKVVPMKLKQMFNPRKTKGSYLLSANVLMDENMAPGSYGATVFAVPSGFEVPLPIDKEGIEKFSAASRLFFAWFNSHQMKDCNWNWEGAPQGVQSGAMGVWKRFGLNNTPVIGLLEILMGVTIAKALFWWAGIHSMAPPSINSFFFLSSFYPILIPAILIFSAIAVLFLLGHKYSGIVNPDGSLNAQPTWGQAAKATLYAMVGMVAGYPFIIASLYSNSILASSIFLIIAIVAGGLVHGGINFVFIKKGIHRAVIDAEIKIFRGELSGFTELSNLLTDAPLSNAQKKFILSKIFMAHMNGHSNHQKLAYAQHEWMPAFISPFAKKPLKTFEVFIDWFIEFDEENRTKEGWMLMRQNIINALAVLVEFEKTNHPNGQGLEKHLNSKKGAEILAEEVKEKLHALNQQFMENMFWSEEESLVLGPALASDLQKILSNKVGIFQILEKIEGVDPLGLMSGSRYAYFFQIHLPDKKILKPQNFYDLMYLLLFEVLPDKKNLIGVNYLFPDPNPLTQQDRIVMVIRGDTISEAREQLKAYQGLPFWDQAIKKKAKMDIVFSSLRSEVRELLKVDDLHHPRILFSDNLSSPQAAKDLLISSENGPIQGKINVFLTRQGPDLPVFLVEALSELQNDESFKDRLHIYILESLISYAFAVRLTTNLHQMDFFRRLAESQA